MATSTVHDYVHTDNMVRTTMKTMTHDDDDDNDEAEDGAHDGDSDGDPEK